MSSQRLACATLATRGMEIAMSVNQHRRAQRRAESRLFEAIAAADDGNLRLAEHLLERAAIPRRACRAAIDHLADRHHVYRSTHPEATELAV